MEKKEDIERKLVTHFRYILKEPEVDRKVSTNTIISAILKLVTWETKQNLMCRITMEEVE